MICCDTPEVRLAPTAGGSNGAQDYQLLGNLRVPLGTHWPTIVAFAQGLDRIKQRSSVFDVAHGQHDDPDTAKNLGDAVAMGFTADNCSHHKAYADEFPLIFEPVFSEVNFVSPSGSILHQKPGWFCPWHADIFTFYARSRGIVDKRSITRHLVFLEDWSPGHYLLVGNSVVHAWEAGDVITWPYGAYHLSANAGFRPKLTLQITGQIRP